MADRSPSDLLITLELTASQALDCAAAMLCSAVDHRAEHLQVNAEPDMTERLQTFGSQLAAKKVTIQVLFKF